VNWTERLADDSGQRSLSCCYGT